MWKTKEIVVNNKVKDDPTTVHILKQCKDSLISYVNDGKPKTIINTSKILSSSSPKMLDKIIAGKEVLYIAPAGDAVDVFRMPDDRMLCPHFDRLKLASNGCFYKCDWCYLKLTYRAAFPYICVHVEYDKIEKQLTTRLSKVNGKSVIFNSGELADSLSMNHITRAGEAFIPYFAKSPNGYLFMLTKSDNVDGILDLEHNQHTIIAWR